MKKLLSFFIFLLPFVVSAQIHPIIGNMGTMEYWQFAFGSDHKIYVWAGGTVQTLTTLPDGGTIVSVGCNFNAVMAVSSMGHLYLSNPYNTGGLTVMTQIATDTTGAPINNAIAVWGHQSTYILLRADSTVSEGGNDLFNIIETTGAIMRPIQISPAGVKIRSIRIAGGGPSANNPIMGISSDSSLVYLWKAGSGNSPATLPTTIGTHKWLDFQSDGGNQFGFANYGIVQMTAGSPYGHMVVTGNNSILFGKLSGTSVNYTTPHDLTTDLGFSSNTAAIGLNGFGCIMVDSVHNAYEMGGYNMQGQLGIGSEIVNRYTYGGFPGYGWSFIGNEDPVYGVQQVGVGHSWAKVDNNGFFVFYCILRDVNDSIYYTGRCKNNVCALNYQMQANDYASHPNCCDLTSFTEEHAQTFSVPTYAWTAPTWSAGSNQTISSSSTTIAASGAPPKIVRTVTPFDTVLYTISTTAWTQVSGPNTATITSASSQSTTVTGLISGTYVFQNLETDNNGGTQASTMQVTVSASGTPPTVNVSGNDTITAPMSTTNLYATITYNGGASGSANVWSTQGSPIGAPAPTITQSGSLTAPRATISGLVAGTYQFQLSSTDSNSNTTTVTVTVVVNAAGHTIFHII